MLEKLQEIVRHHKNDEGIVITGDTVLLADLGLGSYEFFELVSEVEDRFGIVIPDRIIVGFKTVHDVLDYIAGDGLIDKDML